MCKSKSFSFVGNYGLSSMRYPYSLILTFLLALVGCSKDGSFEYQQILPFQGTVFDLFADDLDGDARKDIVMISHGRDYARISYQKQPRQFGGNVDVSEVGFHPGTLLRWPGKEPIYLLNGEGVNELKNLAPNDKGGLSLIKALPEKKPLHSAIFHWPGWGEGLMTVPYESDEIILFKDFKPRDMRYSERVVIPITKQRPSVREVGRALVIDDNGDGIDELYYTVGIAGEIWKISYPEKDKPIQPKLVATKRSSMSDVLLTADFNNDGHPDLLLPDKIPDGWLNIFLNNGQGEFKEVPFPNLLPNQELQQFAIARDKTGENVLLVVGVSTLNLIRFPQQWTGGDGADLISIPRQRMEASLASLLTDIDGDGWLDSAVGLDRKTEGAWIAFGPLWDHFKDMESKKFVLKYENVEGIE